MPAKFLRWAVTGLLAALGLLLVAAQRPAPAPPPTLRAFQAVGPSSGWVLLGSQFYVTADAGAHWSDRTPPAVPGALVAGWFVDEKLGWLVSLAAPPGADPLYTLLHTTDGGATWQSTALALFAPQDTAALAGAVTLRFTDAQTGTLVIQRATSSAFDLRAAFTTTDGGRTWARLPDAEALTLQPGSADLSLANSSAGWARTAIGDCAAPGCTLTVQLQQTTDGGQTWQPLPLPGGQAALTTTAVVPVANPVAAATSQTGYAFVFNGHAFDGCYVDGGGAPWVGMQTWWDTSPYRARNLYLGGASVAPCTPLTKAYVQVLAQQGWAFVPTWVGPQAPCFVGTKRKMSSDAALAYQQGRVEAYLALGRAQVLGLTGPSGAGTVLYYDLESYTYSPTYGAACQAAVEAFISGWTEVVRAEGSLSGVYGSPCSSNVPALAGIPHVPDAVWLAYWTYGGYDPSASVFGVNCISDTLWSQSQRLRQYAGGHNETWGAVTYNIDSNKHNGPAATVPGDCRPGSQQIALFVYPNYGGQCIVRGLGSYNVENLGLPNDAISSVQIGPGTRVRVCKDTGLITPCTDLLFNAADLAAHAVGDNSVSSYLVETATLTQTNRVYFPLLNRQAGVISPLPNGGFESGPTVWSLSSTNGRALIVTQPALTGTGHTTHGGGWALWLGGVVSETAALAQTVTVPVGGGYLGYWQWVDSDEGGCYYDVLSVWVNDTVVDAYGVCAALETNSWTRRVVDLSAFAGQTIGLRLQFTTDSSDQSSLYLDDLAFESGP